MNSTTATVVMCGARASKGGGDLERKSKRLVSRKKGLNVDCLMWSSYRQGKGTKEKGKKGGKKSMKKNPFR